MTAPTKPEAEVVSKDAGGRTRVHFAGRLRDAVEYVERNFPRVHVEPGSNVEPSADVFVRSTEGDKQLVYMGADSGGHDDSGWHDADANGQVATAVKPEPEPASTEPEPI